MSLVSRFKQLGKDSIVYGLGGILAKGISFFLLPVYTRIFAPADYGLITMLTVISSLLAGLLAMGMDSAQSFYFFAQKESGRASQARLITAILQWRLTWGAAIVGGSLLLAPLLNTMFFDGRLTWEYFAVAFVGALFTQLMNQSVEVFRLLYRPWPYLGITLGNTLVSTVITVVLVVWLDWGVISFFIGSGIGAVIGSLFGWWAIRTYLDWSTWHWDWWPKLVRFGAPLVPSTLAMYVLNTADRWFISFYHGQDALGLYGVGAKFAILIALAITTYRQAWWPISMDAIHSPEGPLLFRTMARLYLGMGSIGIILLTVLSPWLVSFFTAPAYHTAYPIVGILAWQSIFYGFYLISSAGIWKKQATGWYPVIMAIAALLNVALDAWLVPQFGNIGAAVATSTSFFVWNVLAIWISEKLWPIHYPLGILGLQIGLAVAAMSAILILYSQNQGLWIVIAVAAVTTMILAGLTIEPAHLKWLLKQVKKRGILAIGVSR